MNWRNVSSHYGCWKLETVIAASLFVLLGLSNLFIWPIAETVRSQLFYFSFHEDQAQQINWDLQEFLKDIENRMVFHVKWKYSIIKQYYAYDRSD